MNDTTPLMEAKNLVKQFGEITALDDVDFHIDHGEIVGLVGDNGAGKSTLVKALTGIYQPDEGEIFFKGEKVIINSPAAAHELGIEPVHQKGASISEMSVWENFYLGREIVKKFGPVEILQKQKMREITKRRTRELGIDITSVDRMMGTFSGGEQQAVMIGRAINFGGGLLMMDEPTSALSIRETNKVLGYVENVKKDLGKSVIFITHIMRHIYPIADRFVVLWQGRKIADLRKGDLSLEELEDLVIQGRRRGTATT